MMPRIQHAIFALFIFGAFSCSTDSHHKISTDKIVEHHGNGKIKLEKIPFKKDSTKFTYREYYESGRLLKKGTLLDSVVTDYWEYYYENGNLKQKGHYIIDDSLNNGSFTYSYWMPQYDRDGKLIEENDGWMCSLAWRGRENKNLHVCRSGYWEFYFESGALKSKGNFANGWSDGSYYEYHDNRKIALEAQFKKGKPVGTWTTYYPNGQLKESRTYTDSSLLINSCLRFEFVSLAFSLFSIMVKLCKAYSDN